MRQNRKSSLVLRNFRKLHNVTGVVLAVFILLISATGLLLGWKKNTSGYLQPETQTGTTNDLEKWLPLDSLQKLAEQALEAKAFGLHPVEVDRIDVRKSHGVAKFSFINNYYEIQLDGATGQVLHIGKRRSDFIEELHDGSLLDKYFGTDGEIIKLIYSTLIGLAMIMFALTGIYIYFFPKRRRDKIKAKRLLFHRLRDSNK
jgi:uncharacterized iron-regulated membrane protein